MGQKIQRKSGHYEQTAGPSTAPLAMRLQEAPLRMTNFYTNQSQTLGQTSKHPSQIHALVLAAER
jgi:hypothetical protein